MMPRFPNPVATVLVCAMTLSVLTGCWDRGGKKTDAGAGGSTAKAGGPSPAVTPADYTAARAGFKTRLVKEGPAPQKWTPAKVPPGVSEVSFNSGRLRLKGWLALPQKKGDERVPAVLFLHGGFAFGADDFAMARPFLDAGFAVMAPILRGENGQPGLYTMFYDEVDDVLAAGEHLAGLPDVDPKRVFIAGHSAGGTLTMLAALASGRFRAAASLSGCADPTVYRQSDKDLVPFDPSEAEEFRMRSALEFATGFRCPVRMYYGGEEELLGSMAKRTAEKARTAGVDAEAVRVPGNHFTSVGPAMTQAIEFFRAHFAPPPSEKPEG